MESKWEASKVISWEIGIVLKSPSWVPSNWRNPEGAAKCVSGVKSERKWGAGGGRGACLVKSPERNLRLCPGLVFACLNPESHGKPTQWRGQAGQAFLQMRKQDPAPCPERTPPLQWGHLCAHSYGCSLKGSPPSFTPELPLGT